MATSAECYAMARQCEAEAAKTPRPQARQLLLVAAAKWRELGDQIRAQESRASSRKVESGAAHQKRRDR